MGEENWFLFAGERGGERDGDIGGEICDIPIKVEVGEAETEWQKTQQWFRFLYFFSEFKFLGDEPLS